MTINEASEVIVDQYEATQLIRLFPQRSEEEKLEDLEKDQPSNKTL